jgi:hypothetical protein
MCKHVIRNSAINSFTFKKGSMAKWLWLVTILLAPQGSMFKSCWDFELFGVGKLSVWHT